MRVRKSGDGITIRFWRLDSKRQEQQIRGFLLLALLALGIAAYLGLSTYGLRQPEYQGWESFTDRMVKDSQYQQAQASRPRNLAIAGILGCVAVLSSFLLHAAVRTDIICKRDSLEVREGVFARSRTLAIKGSPTFELEWDCLYIWGGTSVDTSHMSLGEKSILYGPGDARTPESGRCGYALRSGEFQVAARVGRGPTISKIARALAEFYGVEPPVPAAQP